MYYLIIFNYIVKVALWKLGFYCESVGSRTCTCAAGPVHLKAGVCVVCVRARVCRRPAHTATSSAGCPTASIHHHRCYYK